MELLESIVSNAPIAKGTGEYILLGATLVGASIMTGAIGLFFYSIRRDMKEPDQSVDSYRTINTSHFEDE